MIAHLLINLIDKKEIIFFKSKEYDAIIHITQVNIQTLRSDISKWSELIEDLNEDTSK